MGRLAWVVLLGTGVYVLIRHHAAYLSLRRRMSFAAFLGTAGWIILALVALTSLGDGWSAPGTRTVELVAGIIAVVFVGIGWRYS